MRWPLITVVVLMGASLMSAQDNSRTAESNDTSQRSDTQDVSASKLTIQGCLQGSETRFTLLQSSTGASFALEGNDQEFRAASGKVVEVNGTELAPAAKTGAQSLPRLRVRELKVVENQCPTSEVGDGAATSNRQPSGGPTQPPASRNSRTQVGPGTPAPPSPGTPINPNSPGATGAPSPGTDNPPPSPPQ
jgi:hypothetical protein